MKSLRLFGFLMRSSRGTMLLVATAGALSGAFSVAVVAVVSQAFYQQTWSARWIAAAFAFLVLGKIATSAIAQLALIRFAQTKILELSLTLCARIVQAPLRQLERQGGGKILAVLTDDVSTVTWAVQCIPGLVTNVAVVLGCGLYLAWLSWEMCLWLAGVTIVGAIAYKVINEKAFEFIHAARSARSELFEHFRTLISGIKELMLNRARKDEFLVASVRSAADEYRRTNLAATWRHTIAEAWVQGLLYLLIGMILFSYPAVERPPVEVLTGYVFTILYMLSPLWTIIGTVPAVIRGQVALRKIEELGLSLEGGIPSPENSAGDKPQCGTAIAMNQVQFEYEPLDGGEPPFCLGPLDFRLKSGEIVFVVGGNGSGKSTFAKVLTGLYPPTQGQIQLDGLKDTKVDGETYREHFSAVFQDFHVFDSLLGVDLRDQESVVLQYLRLLQIDGKVSLKGRTFSTTDLSHGQRKRLALLASYMEDRPFYVFDEWAADQDPDYKLVFYSRLLPDLKRRGKGIVVITHDDRFFHLGDRVVKLDDGRIVSDGPALDASGSTGTA